MAIQTRRVEYTHTDTLLEACMAWDDSAAKPRPGVLVVHAFRGREPFEDGRARVLAELGYVGFALDLYGKGIRVATKEEAFDLMNPFTENRPHLQSRLLAGMEVARAQPEIDAAALAAIGYCFGGLSVLDMARIGAPLQGVCSFHGALAAPGNTAGNKIAARVLVEHGWDDPMVPPQDVLAFTEEMTAAGADWQLHGHGGTVHAFTNPESNDPPSARSITRRRSGAPGARWNCFCRSCLQSSSRSDAMAKINEFQGNIFETSCQTVVNTVNCVGVMGKGIALQFRRRYPEMFKSYVRCCDYGRLKPGLLQLWTKSEPWILNFPTKDDWKAPSKLEYIEKGLIKFGETYHKRGITSVAFPQLGSSSGGLNWVDVRSIMYENLQPLRNLQIEIYLFDPNAKDTFFDRLYQRINRFGDEDYKLHLGIQKKQAQLIREAIACSSVNSMIHLEELQGIGEKTIEKIYVFGNTIKRGERRIMTNAERQPSLLDEKMTA